MPVRQAWEHAQHCDPPVLVSGANPASSALGGLEANAAANAALKKPQQVTATLAAPTPVDAEQLGALFVAAATAVHVALTRVDVDDALLRARVQPRWRLDTDSRFTQVFLVRVGRART